MDAEPDFGKCFYCTRPLDGNQGLEYVLPAAIGAELTTSQVCMPCNRRCTTQVEQPWLRDPFLAPLRRRWAVRGRRRRPRQPTSVGRHLVGDADPLTALDESKVWVSDVAWGERIGSTSRSGEERVRRLERLNLSYPDLNLIESGTVPERPLKAVAPQVGSRDTWPRFGAKVALAVATLVTTHLWLDSPGAKALQDVLWNGYPGSGTAALGPAGDRLAARPSRLQSTDLVRPPEHLLAIEFREHGGCDLVIVVFGELAYRVPFPIECTVEGAQSWWFSPSNTLGRQLHLEEQFAVLRARP